MKRLCSTLCAGALAVATALTSIAPVAAAPVVPAPSVERATDVTQVQERYWRREGRRDFRRDRRDFRRDRRDWRRDSGWRDRPGYYRGYRGYRDYRPGYRRHGDWWFPAGAFVAGALIGGALSAPGPTYYEPRRVYRRVGSAHVQWCYNRYRSYRAYDNTFQPYNGPRRQCYSPYS